MEHRFLKWDSDFFKIKVAEIKICSEDDRAALNETVDRLKNDGCGLAYLLVTPKNEDINSYAQSQNWLMVDGKTTYSTDLDKVTGYADVGVKLYDGKEADERLVSLAIQCGVWSRFKIDHHFPPQAYREMYRLWIEKSISGEMADFVFVHRSKNAIDGMITLSIKDKVGIIGLVGVDESCRGQGVGTMLMDAVKNHCLSQNVKTINVVTQKNNIQACKFYEKCGFKVSDLINLYHIWF